MSLVTELNGFTPMIDSMVAEVGFVPAAVYGVVYRHCRMKEGVCRASVSTMARLLGMSRRAVQLHLKALCDQGYLKDLTPELKAKEHTYVVTQKALSIGQVNAGPGELDSPESERVGESDSLPGESDSPVGGKTGESDSPKDTCKDHEDTLGANAPASEIKKLERQFIDLTHLRPPRDTKARQKRWGGPLKQMHQEFNRRAPDLMRAAIEKLRRDNCTISAPASLLKTMTGLAVEQPPAPAPLALTLEEIARYRQYEQEIIW